MSALPAPNATPFSPILNSDSVSACPQLSAEAQQRAFNQAQLLPRPAMGIHQLFYAQVERTPHAPAVEMGETQLSYRELAQWAGQIARYLQEQGVGPGDMVGVMLPRQIGLLAALLAILQLGAAYVPLDPAYPLSRRQAMLRQARLRHLLSVPELLPEILPDNPHLQALLLPVPGSNMPSLPPFTLTGTELAYLMFTSGSTGQPKGVMIEHGSVVELVLWLQGLLSAAEMARFLASTSINFDLSVVEMFVPLASGGCVVMLEQVLDILHSARDVSLLNTVPSALRALAAHSALPPSVQTVIACGEVLPQSVVEKLFQQGVKRVLDCYGPTEDCVYSTWAERRPGGRAVIGRAKHNGFALVLDEQLRCLPPGECGQLYLAGNGLARGYLHAAELSAQRFIPNPYAAWSGPRLYQTGDLARWNQHGELEYVGRIDNQVQIHGIRVELGEIEHALSSLPGVEQAVVQAWRDPGQAPEAALQLIAYLQLHPNAAPLSLEQVRKDLQQELPSLLLPQHLFCLPAMPLTANGKLDRKALPVPKQAKQNGMQAAAYPYRATLQAVFDLFAASAQARPQAPALHLADGSACLNYAQLQHLAWVLAARLRARGAKPGAHIGVHLHSGFLHIASMLAIWRAGMVYVPLAPDYPRQRLQWMVDDAQLHTCISDAELAAKLALPAQQCLLPELQELLASPAPGADELPPCAVQDVLYLIYTSGSSGRSKGVLGRQQALLNRLLWLHHTCPPLEDEVFCQKTSIGFVDHVAEICQAWLSASPLLLIAPSQVRQIPQLAQLLRTHKVTRLTLVPSLLQALLESGELAKLGQLRLLISSGEALPLRLARACQQSLPQLRLLNLYGSTEVGADVSYAFFADTEQYAADSLPAGRMLPFLQAWILDAEGALCASESGRSGELCISGIGLAAGYWRHTSNAFCPHPFPPAMAEADDSTSSPCWQRMYRSGDLACWLADGSLQLLGRLDDQLKLRGQRIAGEELQQIVLLDGRVQACHFFVDAGRACLIAALQAAEDASLQAALQQLMQQALPPSMQVNHWLFFPEFPLLPNGKLDKPQLRATCLQILAQREQSAALPAPQTEVETCLLTICRSLLGKPDMDAEQDFFQTGGHSLQVLTLCMRLRAAGWQLSAQAVFEGKPLRELARLCQPLAAHAPNTEPAPDEKAEHSFALLANHHWFLQRANLHHWNASHLYRLDADLDLSQLRQAWQALRAHHPALRLRCARHQGQTQFLLTEDAEHSAQEGDVAWWRVIDLSKIAPAQQSAWISRISSQAQTSLDIYRRLWQVLIFDCGPGRARRMLILAHHLIVDAHAYTILLADLERAWSALQKKQIPQLPPTACSLEQWGQAQRDWSVCNGLQYLPYWQQTGWQRCQALPPSPNPSGLEPDSGLSMFQSHLQHLGGLLSTSLTQMARQLGLDLETVLLSAVLHALHAYCGQTSFALKHVHHGRHVRSMPQFDLSHTLGWFANYSLALIEWQSLPPLAQMASVQQQMQVLQDDGLSYSCLRFFHPQAEVQAQMRALPAATLEFNFATHMHDPQLPPWLHEAEEDIGSQDGLLHSGFAPFIRAQTVPTENAGARALALHWAWCPTRHNWACVQYWARDAQAFLQQALHEWQAQTSQPQGVCA